MGFVHSLPNVGRASAGREGGLDGGLLCGQRVGHAPAADEDTEYVEITASAEFAELMRHVSGG